MEELLELKKCPKCKGFIVITDSHDHITWRRDYRCVNCGRYWPVKQQVVEEIPQEWKGTRERKNHRISEEQKSQIRVMVASGIQFSTISRVVGCHHVSVSNLAKKNGWCASKKGDAA